MTDTYWKDEKLKNYFEYCRSVIKKHAKSFYYSSRFFPQDRKWATYAVYCFCRFVDNIVDNPRSRSNDELLRELDNIRTELELSYRYGESEHPAIAAFAHVSDRYKIPKEYSMALVDGAEMDLNQNRYDTFDELYVFCYRVAAVVGLMMTHVMGFEGGKETLLKAEQLGIGMQLTNITRDIAEDMEMNRIYIPKEDMDRFKVSENDLKIGKCTAGMQDLVRFQVDRAKKYYELSYPGIAYLNTESQFAIYSASKIYGSILNEIEKNGYNPFEGRVYLSSTQKTKIVISELVGTRVKAYRAA
jgi:phytoene synthase